MLGGDAEEGLQVHMTGDVAIHNLAHDARKKGWWWGYSVDN